MRCREYLQTHAWCFSIVFIVFNVIGAIIAGEIAVTSKYTPMIKYIIFELILFLFVVISSLISVHLLDVRNRDIQRNLIIAIICIVSIIAFIYLFSVDSDLTNRVELILALISVLIAIPSIFPILVDGNLVLGITVSGKGMKINDGKFCFFRSKLENIFISIRNFVNTNVSVAPIGIFKEEDLPLLKDAVKK